MHVVESVKRLIVVLFVLQALIRLPAQISECSLVLEFFEPKAEDVNPPAAE